ncbi:hypothetical protein ACEQ8H_001054 [Pleosporales sp. CAS-2024a]
MHIRYRMLAALALLLVSTYASPHHQDAPTAPAANMTKTAFLAMTQTSTPLLPPASTLTYPRPNQACTCTVDGIAMWPRSSTVVATSTLHSAPASSTAGLSANMAGQDANANADARLRRFFGPRLFVEAYPQPVLQIALQEDGKDYYHYDDGDDDDDDERDGQNDFSSGNEPEHVEVC